MRRVYGVRDILGFEDAKVMVFAMALEHLALDVNATGLAHYGGYHSDACAVGKTAERYIASKTIERHRRTTGYKRWSRGRRWSGHLAFYVNMVKALLNSCP